MRKWLCVAAGLLSAAPAEAAARTWPSPAMVEAKVDRIFGEYDRPGAPGCAVGVYNAGRILFAKGYGQADIAAQRPITANSVFSIASLTKQFTAFGIALLESEGKLSLDDPVRKYLPQLPEFGSPITVRHLVHHISGLRDYGALMEFTGWKLDEPISKSQLLALLARQRALNFAPGTEHEYGNTNYVLLGMIIERVSGRSYGDFLAERIFRPLGMAGSAFGEPPAGSHRLARNYAPSEHGYFVNHVWARAYAPGVVGIHSSVEDLARWDANFSAPVIGDPNLIGKIYTPARLNSGESSGYGYGQYAGSHRGFRAIGHGGLGGGSFYLVRFPDVKLSVATLCNQYGVGPQAPDSYALAHSVADLFLPAAEAAPAPSRKLLPETAIALPRAELERLAGDYWLAAEGTPITLRLDKAGLAELYGGKLYPMTPLSDGRFRDALGTGYYSFTGPGGNVLTHEADGIRRRAERRPPWSPTADDLRQAIGRYCSSEVEVCWSIERRDDALWLVRPSFARTQLAPAFADTFRFIDRHWIGARNARLTLERNPQGRISGLRVSRGRVRNLLFERSP